jgi:hypothetical protein
VYTKKKVKLTREQELAYDHYQFAYLNPHSMKGAFKYHIETVQVRNTNRYLATGAYDRQRRTYD